MLDERLKGKVRIPNRMLALSTLDEFTNFKVAVVTGGASGIGQCAVQCLRSRGAKVASFDITQMAASNDQELLLVRCDVSDEAQVENAVAMVAAQWGRIDILVNCAGVLDRFGKFLSG
ncbi:Short-chain dehydrogenase reductase 3a [Fulvia fulva]|uniref:Short-chain dehydrogenase reductase 3a n=1 Tax=Passalora fulva TaxID=5499 RepID=A0A9Q8PEU5_PASFU|nr:Short-chain dehydrogenase reductase 3a [Fulvia fulva]KAK4617738.1 Short-chain dehydrogenase reductase 3a [Fulvia fulva]KAK4618645.1 Short-chain dehydrogenase reductase 3a [Fulvia fulva]UJO21201.1 Short-chain dehydrogenase reductase 3a [Fulvia fulva]WPV18393.1 Short-chain dehydrogenase reductase 3a [Fulvia fulva]WPV33368.1 Short-chain dehydrogenase reductase 3a [Fulvia fulva]